MIFQDIACNAGFAHRSDVIVVRVQVWRCAGAATDAAAGLRLPAYKIECAPEDTILLLTFSTWLRGLFAYFRLSPPLAAFAVPRRTARTAGWLERTHYFCGPLPHTLRLPLLPAAALPPPAPHCLPYVPRTCACLLPRLPAACHASVRVSYHRCSIALLLFRSWRTAKTCGTFSRGVALGILRTWTVEAAGGMVPMPLLSAFMLLRLRCGLCRWRAGPAGICLLHGAVCG